MKLTDKQKIALNNVCLNLKLLHENIKSFSEKNSMEKSDIKDVCKFMYNNISILEEHFSDQASIAAIESNNEMTEK